MTVSRDSSNSVELDTLIATFFEDNKAPAAPSEDELTVLDALVLPYGSVVVELPKGPKISFEIDGMRYEVAATSLWAPPSGKLYMYRIPNGVLKKDWRANYNIPELRVLRISTQPNVMLSGDTDPKTFDQIMEQTVDDTAAPHPIERIIKKLFAKVRKSAADAVPDKYKQ